MLKKNNIIQEVIALSNIILETLGNISINYFSDVIIYIYNTPDNLISIVKCYEHQHTDIIYIYI